MTNEELQAKITRIASLTATFEEGGEWLNITSRAGRLAIAGNSNFAMNRSLCFDYLFCLTCVDWKTHLTMVYHLSTTTSPS